MLNTDDTKNTLVKIINDPRVMSLFPLDITAEFLDKLKASSFNERKTSFVTAYEIESKSSALIVNNNDISLAQDWGVKLNNLKNKFINNPVNIKYANNKFFITNSPPTGSTEPCCVLDENLNLIGTVGIFGVGSGKYNNPVDFDYSHTLGRYYITSSSEHKINVYDGVNKSFLTQIGSGSAGANGTDIDTPVCVGIGQNYIYVLCNKGTPTGSTGLGFLARYTIGDNLFKDFILYPGINNGDGSCFSGEISEPKDMKMSLEKGIEYIYILNKNNEIGKYNATTNKFDKVYNIPSDFYSPTAGYNKIHVDDKYLYVLATNIGKIIVLDLATGKFVSAFGKLADESSVESDQTLGVFNGLSGLAVFNKKIYTTESLNNRIQSFGIELIGQPYFEIIYQPTNIGSLKRIFELTYPLGKGAVEKVTVIDINKQNSEYSVDIIKTRMPNFFKIKLYITPHAFSQNKNSFTLEPIYILLEDK